MAADTSGVRALWAVWGAARDICSEAIARGAERCEVALPLDGGRIFVGRVQDREWCGMACGRDAEEAIGAARVEFRRRDG